MRAAVAIVLLCALLAQAATALESKKLSAEARRGLVDDAVNSAASKVVDWLRSGVQSSISTIRTAVENDVTAARTTAQNAVSATKQTVLSSCKSAVDLAAGGVNTFNTKINDMKNNLKNEVAQIANGLVLVKTLLEQFGQALAGFFTPAFDVTDAPGKCTVPVVFDEVNTFFKSYLGVQPIDPKMWCRFIAIAAKAKLDGAFQKMFGTQRPLFKSTAFLEVSSETGEAAAVSEEVLLASVDWNVINVVYETFDGAVDIVGLILSALDSGPVEEAATKAETGGVDPQLVVAFIAVVFKLTSSGLKAAAVAKGCNAS